MKFDPRVVIGLLAATILTCSWLVTSKNWRDAKQRKQRLAIIAQRMEPWSEIRTVPLTNINACRSGLDQVPFILDAAAPTGEQMGKLHQTLFELLVCYTDGSYSAYTNFQLRFPYEFNFTDADKLKMTWAANHRSVQRFDSEEAVRATWEILSAGNRITELDFTNAVVRIKTQKDADDPIIRSGFANSAGAPIGLGVRVIHAVPTPETVVKAHNQITFALAKFFVRTTRNPEGVTLQQKQQATPIFFSLYWEPERHAWLPCSMGRPGVAGAFKVLF